MKLNHLALGAFALALTRDHNRSKGLIIELDDTQEPDNDPIVTVRYSKPVSAEDYAPKRPSRADRHMGGVSPLIRKMVFDGVQARPSFTTEKPLSKRKRRRLRGKGDTK